MRVIGLTGGIATGKSTAARILAEFGAPVIDADAIAREVVAPGQPALAELVDAFGPDVLQPDGTLDRKRVGALVFADPAKRQRLNAITHPRIAAETMARLGKLADERAPVAIYEAALLVENRIHEQPWLEGLIVTTCDEATQLARLMERDGYSEAEARARIAAQAPLADKLAAATWVVDTSGPLTDTKEQLVQVWAEIGARK